MVCYTGWPVSLSPIICCNQFGGVPAACGPLLQLATAQVGQGNSPNWLQQNRGLKLTGHPVHVYQFSNYIVTVSFDVSLKYLTEDTSKSIHIPQPCIWAFSCLISEPVWALDGVVHVPAPVVGLHVAERRVDAALRRHSVRPSREQLRDDGSLEPLLQWRRWWSNSGKKTGLGKIRLKCI